MAEAITYADLRFVKAPLKNISNHLGQDPDADEDGDITYENVQVSPPSAGLKAGVSSQQPEAYRSSVESPAAGRLLPCCATHIQYFFLGLLVTCLLFGVAAMCLGVRYLQVSQQLQLISEVLENTNNSLRQELVSTISQLRMNEKQLQESKKELVQSQQEQKVCQETKEQLHTCQSEREELQKTLHSVGEQRTNLEQRLSRIQWIKKFILCTSPDICCPVGWTQTENYCFHISHYRRNWSDSKEYCTSLSSELASLSDRSYSDYSEILNKLFTGHRYYYDSYWTGLKYIVNQDWYSFPRSGYLRNYAKTVFNLSQKKIQEERGSSLLPCICQMATFSSPDRDGSLH